MSKRRRSKISSNQRSSKIVRFICFTQQRLEISTMQSQAVSSLSLNLCYEGQTDFDGILNKLREAENVEEIEFQTSCDGEQDNENICKIIKKILIKPKLNKITYDIGGRDVDDFNGMEIDGEFPTVAMNELLCLKNAGSQISLFFTSYE